LSNFQVPVWFTIPLLSVFDDDLPDTQTYGFDFDHILY
jgi:hypothetical protein